MIKVGITGQAGFIGKHLSNYLSLKKYEVTLIPFQDDYFSQQVLLEEFVRKCDAIVHLAALNRHNEPQTIYETNIELVNKLISALDNTGSTPHLIFSSSIQEVRDNSFGRSKRVGRALLNNWAVRNGAHFTGMVIPNVFGPFGNPYYNSVVATFSHQLTHDEQPRIEVDNELSLIYVGDIVEVIYSLILNKITGNRYVVPPTDKIKVTEILKMLQNYKDQYIDNGILPNLSHPFERNMFNTFVNYLDHSKQFPVMLKQNIDDRGSFVETVRFNSGGQISFAITKPGAVRGNHFHTRKAERFAVIKGKGLIQIRRVGTEKIMNFKLDGTDPSFVDMPIWHTHSIKNIGQDDLYTIFWISEIYDPNDSDTFFEEV